MGEGKGAHWILVCKAEENTPIGRPRRRWKYNFKINLKEISWNVVRDKCSCEHRN
jgi:hypothetical protein